MPKFTITYVVRCFEVEADSHESAIEIGNQLAADAAPILSDVWACGETEFTSAVENKDS